MTAISPFMDRVDPGTEEDDVIVGSMGNDTIEGFEGDDVLVGLTGSDVIAGGPGDDVVDGGVGDDAMSGGAGDDTLIATEGDDNVNGGAGSDHYVVNGTAGDYVFITDTSGECDVLDARGAITSAHINMNAGEQSYVDGRVIELAGGERIVSPLDLTFLQDLSGSYSDDLGTVRGLLDDLIMGVEDIAPDTNYGLTSFIDKPISPFGSPSDHEFREDLALTDDSDAFKAAYDALTTGSGSDGPESQLTALQQVAVRSDSVGWRSDALRVAVLFTDAEYHEEGDHETAPDGSPIPDNNGDGILDGTPEGTGEDYPSVAAAAMALAAEGISVVLAVTSGVRDTYNDLAEMLRDEGVSVEVVTLESDSGNLVKAVTRGVERLSSTEIEKAIGGDLDDIIIGNALDNVIRGRDGDDMIDGGRGNDLLKGGGGDDEMVGGAGNDTMEGADGNDIMNGGGGRDEMNGGAGDDELRGAGGNDMLNGGAGDDVLLGGSGSDTLKGGAGDDTLDGQGKSDVFVFDGAWGDDVIEGFSPSGTGGADDLLMIDGVTDLATFSASATQVGDDVVYDDGTSTITIKDTELTDMSDADFV